MNFSIPSRTCVTFRQLAALIIFIFALLVGSPAQAAQFIGLGVLPGGIFESRGLGVSADGAVVVGESSNLSNAREALRWTEAGGMVGLGIPATAVSRVASGASANGSVVVGSSGSGLLAEAFRWTEATGIVGLGYLSENFPRSFASGVSANGSAVVGDSQIGSAIGFFIPTEAFRWTETTGMTGLGFLPTHGSSVASAVSADGTVVAGSSRPANTTDPGEAFRWTPATGMAGLGQLGGSYVASGAAGISADGTVVVGTANNNIPSVDILFQAFRWTEAAGMVGLGHLPGDDGSFATDASADGSIVVGSSRIGFLAQHAFIWDSDHGMRDLQEVLINDFGLGANLAGWTLYEAAAISDNGRVIVGTGLNPLGEREAWVAIVPEPSSIFFAICAGVAVPLLLSGANRPRGERRSTSIDAN